MLFDFTPVSVPQWRSKREGASGGKGEGESGGGTRPRAQALGAHQETFCSHLKTRF